MVDIVARVVPAERRAGAGRPATHALVIGVSAYRHLLGGPEESPTGRAWQLGQLSSAAGSATAVAAWLAAEYHNPAAPLGSLRVLVSPTANDRLDPRIAPEVAAPEHRATRDRVEAAFAAFMADCDRDVENVAIVYVAGHGVQLTKHEATVLLEDIAAPGVRPSLRGAIDLIQCHSGMDHAATAGTQFWFVDACRQPPEIAAAFAAMKGAYQIDELPGAARSSQCFLSASTLQQSFGRPGGHTLFCEALLRGLRGAAVCPPTPPLCDAWHVSSYSLSEALTRHVADQAGEAGEVQTVHHFTRGLSPQAVLHRLPGPPRVDLTVRLAPPDAAPVTTASVYFESGSPVPDVPVAWPLVMQLEAGLYSLALDTQQPYRRFSRPINLLPPGVELEARVAP